MSCQVDHLKGVYLMYWRSLNKLLEHQFHNLCKLFLHYLERISETSWMGTIARGKFPPCPPPPPPPNALLLLMLCVCASPPRFSVLMMSNSPRYVYINHHHDRWWWIIRVREEETILRRNFKVVAVQTNEQRERSFLINIYPSSCLFVVWKLSVPEYI